MPRRLDREKDVKEYAVDLKMKKCPAVSLSSISDEQRPMDEISLLKKGYTDRYGHQLHPNGRGKPYTEKSTPISLQELTTRGLLLDDGQIIYSLPGQSMHLRDNNNTSWGMSPVTTSELIMKPSATSILSNMTVIEPISNMTTYKVGLPRERAYLRMGDTKHGKRYDLTIGKEFQFMLTDTEATTTIVAFNT